MKPFLTIIVAAALLALGSTHPRAAQVAHGDTPKADEPAWAFLAKHCKECHGAEKPKGEFRVDQLTADFDSQPNRDRWLAALKRVQSGEMPPKGKPRPAEKDVRAFSTWITTNADAA